MREKPWYVRVALLLTGVWAVWLSAFVVSALSFSELRTGDAAFDHIAASVIIFVFVAIGLVAAIWRPGVPHEEGRETCDSLLGRQSGRAP